MMKKLCTGGITSRKRFAGKPSLSAKHVSTTLLLLLLCLIMPQGVKAGDWNGNTGTFDFSKYSDNYTFTPGSTVKNSSNDDVTVMVDAAGQLEGRFATNGSLTDNNKLYVHNNGLYFFFSGGKIFSILNLFPSDKVTITYRNNSESNLMTFRTSGQANGQSAGTTVQSETTYTISSTGSLDFNVPRYIVIEKIEIYQSGNKLAFDTSGKAGDKDGLPYYRFRLSDRYFNEPILNVRPANSSVTYTVENYGTFPKEVAVMNQQPGKNGDVLFKNLGWCKVTATANGMTDSYLVEVWDNVADYVTEEDGTKFRFTEAGELTSRVIRAVGGLETWFGIPGKDENGTPALPDYGVDNSDYHYQPNTVVVSEVDGHYVSSVRSDDGWWDRWPYHGGAYPKQGTFYVFKATEKGKLKFGGIKLYKGGQEGQATVDMVNSAHPYETHVTVFKWNEEGYVEVQDGDEISMDPGDIYYMHGTTPTVTSGTSQFDSQYDNQWSVFLLEWFSFETEFKITEDGSTNVTFGVAAKTGYEVTNGGSVTSRAHLSVINNVEVNKVEYKGKITSASVSIGSDGRINFSNIQFSTSGEDKMGGAIKVTFKYGSSYKEYVQTIPYGKHVWDFRQTANQSETDAGDYSYTEESLLAAMNANGTDWNRVYKVAKKTNGVWDKDNPKGPAMVAKSSIRGNNAFYMDNTVGLTFLTGGDCFGAGETKNSSAEGLDDGDAKMKLSYTTVEGTDLLWMRGNNASIVFPGMKAGQYVKIYFYRHADNKGETFRAKNFVDLDNVPYDYTKNFIMRGMWDDRYPAFKGDLIKGAVIFRVPASYTATDDVEAMPTLTLDDSGWAEIYKIEITDEFKPDLVMVEDATSLPIDYDGVYGSVVIKDKEQVMKSFWSTTGNTHCQHANTCDYEVDLTNGLQVAVERKIKNSKDDGSGVDYNQLFLRFNKGTGLVKIIQRERANASGTGVSTNPPSADLGYVVDKNEYYIAVGELNSQQYPFTWDFTSYNMYQGSSATKTNLGSTTVGEYGNWNADAEDTSGNEFGQKHMVEETFGTNDVEQNATTNKQLFAQGSQLTAGTTVIAESEGLGFSRPKKEQKDYVYVATVNGTFGVQTRKYDAYDLQDNGFQITGEKLCGAGTIIIPNVAKDMYVFVKGTAPTSVSHAAEDTSLSPITGAKAYKSNYDGDVVLTFASGSEIEMIGVTDITKSVNKLGFATESRTHAIDHSYTGEFTKNDVNAYIITSDNYNYEAYKGATISLGEPVDVIPANTGVVLYKSGTTEQTTVPLFYPAVNVANSSVEGNMMVAMPNGGTVNPKNGENGEYTSFIMSMFKGTYNSTTGQSSTPTEQTYEGFYPIQTAGTIGANKAYLQIPTESIPTALWDGGDGQGIANQAKGYILIDVDYEGNGEATAIDHVSVDTENATSANGDVYYNLSGQKLMGTPTAKGIYVKNGKKVYVK